MLTIIGNLKHYLGDSWETILPGGIEDVDEFLKMVDTQHVLDTDTWSRYEKHYSHDPEDGPVEDEG